MTKAALLALDSHTVVIAKMRVLKAVDKFNGEKSEVNNEARNAIVEALNALNHEIHEARTGRKLGPNTSNYTRRLGT